MHAPRILLVEDDPIIRAAVLRLLVASGLAVTSVGDGKAAKEAMEEDADFDLLVTDIRMPGQFDGLAVASQWRQRHRHCPIVFVSSHFDDDSLTETLGPRDILIQKPFRRADFIGTIRGLLSHPDQVNLS